MTIDYKEPIAHEKICIGKQAGETKQGDNPICIGSIIDMDGALQAMINHHDYKKNQGVFDRILRAMAMTSLAFEGYRFDIPDEKTEEILKYRYLKYLCEKQLNELNSKI